MASSTTTGERRWAPARRGGMTVLGKVAVPKPINLPSQRLENHGLDPNVEIVPKGTLSWGSRQSSSASNAWGSSVLSPRNEGGGGSPSRLSGRPSSGGGRPSSGGGSRPSTANSEITYESTGNAWTSNSRPSSASGSLASNNTSLTALRPRSAETRPGSSQLSRFAEPLSEGSAVWGPSRAADKLGIQGSTRDAFSLSSGDFPTLGSEKSSGQNGGLLDHSSNGRPGSSSGGPNSKIDKVDSICSDGASQSTDVKGGMANSQNQESPLHIEDGPHQGMETWHRDPYPFPNANIPPQSHPYEVWRGAPPVNPPGGVWYRPAPGAPHPSYGGPIHPPHGGFPMEPFNYYRPQVPGPGIPNSQSVPPQGAGPHVSHSKNGDRCRPLMEPYMHPGMPIRPGFYPGYYGPPMGYCNPNERDFTYMGVPPGPPPAYNRYAVQNAPELNNSHSRNSEGRSPEEPGPLYESRGQHIAPVKHNSGQEKNGGEKHGGVKVMPNAFVHDRGYPEKSWAGENPQAADYGKGKRPLPSEEATTLSIEHKDGSGNPPVKFHGNACSVESAKPVAERVTSKRDHSLIQKIEGLNAKSRASDGRPYDRVHPIDSKPSYPISAANANVHLERHHPSGVLVHVPSDMSGSAEGKSVDASTTEAVIPRPHVVQGKGDYQGKSGFNSHESEGRRKRSAILESPNVVPAANPQSNTGGQAPNVLSMDLSRSDGEVKSAVALATHDPCDSQRAKMKVIAKQRAAQRQKEEEERSREQKAKALAKLEELNKRSGNLSAETSSQKLETVVCETSDQVKVEKSEVLNVDDNQPGEMSSTLVFGSNDPLVIKTSESGISSGLMCSEIQKTSSQGPVTLQSQPLPVIYDGVNDDRQAVSQYQVQNRVSFKQKQSNAHPEKIQTGKQVVTKMKDKSNADVSASKEVPQETDASASSEVNVAAELCSLADSSVQPRKRSNKAVKNKHKVDEVMPREPELSKSVTDDTKLNSSESKFESYTSNSKSLESKNAKQSAESNTSSLLHEDAQGRTMNSWKPQQQRKTLRNSQGRQADKSQGNEAVVWAPVKQQNKIEENKGNEQKATESAPPSTKNDHVVVQSTQRSKRAEIERYVPKPVAKELAQHGNTQQPSSAAMEQIISDSASNGSGLKEGSQSSEKTGKPAEPRRMEITKPHQMKAHGSWRQRGSTVPNPVHGSEENTSSDTNFPRDGSVHEQSAKGLEHLGKWMISKSDEGSFIGQPSKADEIQAVNDGWNTVNELIASSTPATFTGVKSHHGAFGRGRKHSLRGQRGGGHHHQNLEQKNPNGFEHYAPATPSSEINQLDNRPTSSKDTQNAHWQRKSQANIPHEQQGNRNRSRGWQTVTEGSEKITKRDTSLNHDLDHQSHDSQGPNSDLPQPQPVQSAVGMDSCMGDQESRREKKHAQVKGRPYSPIEEPLLELESGAVGDGNNNNQRPSSSGFRKNGNYNGRFDKVHDYQGDKGFSRQDGALNYASGNRDRKRQSNSHYEYQPVGQSGNRPIGQRFGERGPTGHSRRGRGGFYGRQRGNDDAQVDDNYKS